MTITITGAAVSVILLTVFGCEAKGVDFNEEDLVTPGKGSVEPTVTN